MEKKIDNVLTVKVGTSTLTKIEDGREQLDLESFNRIGSQVTELTADGYNVVLVSSGAISAGAQASNLNSRLEAGESMIDMQRLASIGWRHVLNAWADSLGDVTAGELLLTNNDLRRRSERNEATKVIHNLLFNNCVAIVNENDAISHDEIAVGDNDNLAARLSARIRQSKLFGNTVKLVMLSDIDGVYEDVDNKNSLISRIDDLNEFAHVAGGGGGTGGMRTKFTAANTAIDAGIDTWIANGRTEDVIRRAIQGELGTHITAGIKQQRIALAASYSEMG